VFIVFLVKAIFYTHNPNSASKSILFYLPQNPKSLAFRLLDA